MPEVMEEIQLFVPGTKPVEGWKGWRGILQQNGMWGELVDTDPQAVEFLDKMAKKIDLSIPSALEAALEVYKIHLNRQELLKINKE